MVVLPHSVEFFEKQFKQQAASGDFSLNPFETLALPYLHGRVLDLGCGLGNLAIAAARQGADVTALDASATALASLEARAREEGLSIRTQLADLRRWQPDDSYDAIACVGLLMFFDRATALETLRAIADAVVPGGIAIVNVLVEGTTYMAMFDPVEHHLFTPQELVAPFDSWERIAERLDDFPAPDGRLKRFMTLIARRPKA